jgi:hypothetical protein
VATRPRATAERQGSNGGMVMLRDYSWVDCAIAAAVLLPVVALIVLGRAIGITVLVLWQTLRGEQ